MIFATFTPAPDYIVTPALYLQGRAQDWKLEGERCATVRLKDQERSPVRQFS